MSGPQLGISGSLLKCNVAKESAHSLLAGLKRLLDPESGIASSSLMSQWIRSWYDLIKMLPALKVPVLSTISLASQCSLQATVSTPLTISCTAISMKKKIRQSVRAVASLQALNPDLPSRTFSV